MPMKDKARQKATRHRYYLANKEAFKVRGKKWRDANSFQCKLARGLGISLREAGEILRKDCLPGRQREEALALELAPAHLPDGSEAAGVAPGPSR